MSKEISKSYLEKIIQKKAEERAEQEIKNMFSSFASTDINGIRTSAIAFNDKCGELAGKTLFEKYVTSDKTLVTMNDFDAIFVGEVLNKYTNWLEVKKELIEMYKRQETDNILGQLNGINDFLENYGG